MIKMASMVCNERYICRDDVSIMMCGCDIQSFRDLRIGLGTGAKMGLDAILIRVLSVGQDNGIVLMVVGGCTYLLVRGQMS